MKSTANVTLNVLPADTQRKKRSKKRKRGGNVEGGDEHTTEPPSSSSKPTATFTSVTPSPTTKQPKQQSDLAQVKVQLNNNTPLPPNVIDIDKIDIYGYNINPNPTPTKGSYTNSTYTNSEPTSANSHLYHLQRMSIFLQQKTNTRVSNASTNNIDSAIYHDSYGPDYYKWCFEHEQKYAIGKGYIDRQKGLTESMRGILIDWLVELTEEYRLQAATLFMAVNLVDRYLMVREVDRSMLQCLGCACMLISAKFEEIHPPAADDFVYISDNTYNRSQITKMESDVCGALEFRLSTTTTSHFVSRFVRASGGSLNEQMLVNYFIELMLLDYSCITKLPSLLAASATYLARATLRRGNDFGQIWTPTLRHYTGYNVAELKDTVLKLHALHSAAEEGSLKSIFNKYKTPSYLRVALMTVISSDDLKFSDQIDYILS